MRRWFTLQALVVRRALLWRVIKRRQRQQWDNVISLNQARSYDPWLSYYLDQHQELGRRINNLRGIPIHEA
jgi:hypothetical protein